jgi:glycosyltransferase involved in cell wall biosynthesis
VAVGVLKNRFLIRISEGFERFLYRHADELVVNSPGFIDHISQRGGKNIQLVENGVDISMFNPHTAGEGFRKENNLEGKFIVLYAGAHGISNNLEMILEAASQTLDEPKIQYLFLGDGKEKANLIASAKSRNLTNVLFLPSIPKEQINSILSAADACIAILKPIEMYKTTYPNKVFDYMAAGKPILLMIDGVIREVVEKAECGIFIQPDDPKKLAETIKSMQQNPGFYSTMGTNGRRFAEEHFNRQMLARKMEEILLKAKRNHEK